MAYLYPDPKSPHTAPKLDKVPLTREFRLQLIFGPCLGLDCSVVSKADHPKNTGKAIILHTFS